MQIKMKKTNKKKNNNKNKNKKTSLEDTDMKKTQQIIYINLSVLK